MSKGIGGTASIPETLDKRMIVLEDKLKKIMNVAKHSSLKGMNSKMPANIQFVAWSDVQNNFLRCVLAAPQSGTPKERLELGGQMLSMHLRIK